ncbi:LOW QUALITY PROTEIN: hypothetical protein JCM19037_3966 [Geomicrobium sp. JCM 19037]|nr:LOW QUALITY PROTEIN: hypothetical protein JCM19037_3966 [Geomicrobium sp. JCM 19037]
MLRRFFTYYRPYKKLFMITFISAIFVSLLELAFPIIVNQVVDRLLPQGNITVIIIACAVLFLIYIFNSGAHYIVTYWGHILGINIETDMRRDLFQHVQQLSYSYHDNNKTGHLLSNLTNDLFEIGEVAHHGPEDVFTALMTLFGSFGVMLYINWQLAVLTFIVVPFLAWVVIFCNRKMSGAMRVMFHRMAAFNARVEDTLGGIRLVQAFANEKHEQDLFKEDNENFKEAKIRSYRIMGINNSLSYMMMRIMTLFVLLAGAYFMLQNQLSVGDFMAFILLTNIFFRPIEKINASLKATRRIRRITLHRHYGHRTDRSPRSKPFGLKGNIEYNDVSFGYTKEQPVLENINLTISQGETIAFVGPSGAGKTTLCSLLPRFYEIDSGSISIDGHDLSAITLESLRHQIGVVQQDVFMFSGSLRDNIRYGNLDASDEEVMDAARLAELEEFVYSQPDGLDTIVGERGVKLSGGQKQRLSIARMFLKNPPILILDEATSALIQKLKLPFNEHYNDFSTGRTTLVIAHRLATIRHADRIVVVTKDGIAEEGSHEQLLQKGGHYSRLYHAQQTLI